MISFPVDRFSRGSIWMKYVSANCVVLKKNQYFMLFSMHLGTHVLGRTKAASIKIPPLRPISWTTDLIDGQIVPLADACTVLCGCWERSGHR
jgi:hypothetical protein